MTPTLLKTLAKLHPVVITLWGDDLIDAEIITRELRRVMTVICELDDEWEGRSPQGGYARLWRRRLWVTR